MRFNGKICFFAVVAATCLGAPYAHAGTLNFVSDLIIDSRPSFLTSHTITFETASAIPASGKIVIAFEGGAFGIDSSMNYFDADLLVSTSSPLSGFVNRPLAASADAANDGVSITAPSGPVTITLNSASGIAAGSYVQILLGTNASFGSAGLYDITNPAVPGSYHVRLNTYDASGGALDYNAPIVAIVASVAVTADTNDTVAPAISNVLPAGTIPGNIAAVLLSFNTDKYATCRYATSSGIAYGSMTNTFAADALHTFFTTTVTGLQNNTSYAYYIRCVNFSGIMNTSDTVLAFTEGYPLGTTSGPQGGGGGGGGGGAQFPATPTLQTSLIIKGVSLPGLSMSLLEDGALSAAPIYIDASGNFNVTIPTLVQGNYSYTLNVKNGDGAKISTYTTTITVVGGTQTSITGILMPPSLSLEKDTVPPGGSVRVSGISEVSSTVEIWIAPSTQATGANTLKHAVTADKNGNWEYALSTAGLKVDTYAVKARSSLTGYTTSNFSIPAYLGVGQAPVIPSSIGDLNGDGKVNLVDFSILLFHWGPGASIADLNGDGQVNLVDFSILLFHWTG